ARGPRLRAITEACRRCGYRSAHCGGRCEGSRYGNRRESQAGGSGNMSRRATWKEVAMKKLAAFVVAALVITAFFLAVLAVRQERDDKPLTHPEPCCCKPANKACSCEPNKECCCTPIEPTPPCACKQQKIKECSCTPHKECTCGPPPKCT